MFTHLGRFVSRYSYVVIAAWLALVAVTNWYAPRWDDVTHDGDLAYMPDSMSSVQAERLLEEAFPRRRSKSEMVLLLSRADQEDDDGSAKSSSKLTAEDLKRIDLLAARMHNLLGVSRYLEAERLFIEAAEQRDRGKDKAADKTFLIADEAQRRALAAWDEAIRLNPQFSAALNNRAYFHRMRGNDTESIRDIRLAKDFAPEMEDVGKQLRPADVNEMPLLDVWTRHTDVVGPRLRSPDRRAELIVLRLNQEFMATDNMRILNQVREQVAEFEHQANADDRLRVDVTGSAAVGGDMLMSAKESIDNTELYTVVLVITILVVVYRAPLLVAVPLITIIVSVNVSTGWVAALTQLHRVQGFEWWNFKIFTTTKIFVVVILFGAGTDFCLFLISRYKEELDRGEERRAAVRNALSGVGDALTASALTTIVGLSTMFFAEFGKFRNSGPAIGLCLAVTLAACLTLAPALLRAFGKPLFWPRVLQKPSTRSARAEAGRAGGIWDRLAHLIVSYPGRVLVISAAVLTPLAVSGTQVPVTYDFLSELDSARPSKQGAQRMNEYFPVGKTSPLVVLAHVPGRDLDEPAGKKALAELTRKLYVSGVQSVRSLAEPRGEPPSGFSLKKAALQSHEITRSLYLSKQPQLEGDVARFELLLEHDPFSLDAIRVLDSVDKLVDGMAADPEAYWHDAEFLFAGTTSAIRDLRSVTRADNVRIQILVVLAVLAVLLIILRRPIVCLYLIASVLFSYYVTMGATEWFFQFAYGDTFHGLDWKVPLFLFVILVAIGQDYNIYLATRVFEEQAKHGLFGGLRRAIVRTGGIITSCGIIMAGTFVSMTAGTLRGIVELGFALSLGVLLDTFVVRPILVPAFMALLFRWFAGQQTKSIIKSPKASSVAPPHTTSSTPTSVESQEMKP